MTVGRVLSDSDYREARDAEERRLRRNAQRRVWTDQRTRIARRVKTLEAGFRARLRAQGRELLLHDDAIIGALAQCVVQIELLNGERSHGAEIDDEQLTRLLNTQQRLIAQLGLKPSALEPVKPAPSLASLIRGGSNGG